MGLLVNGEWRDQWYDTGKTGGSFERTTTSFRRWVTADGGPGPNGQPGVKAEAGRFHLYVSLACPWAHRTLIARRLKGLEEAVTLSVVDWFMGEEGWTFSDRPGTLPDTVNGAKRLYEIYLEADPHYTGRVTVPVLWDKQENTIVSNESAEILRMFNRSFHGIADAGAPDLYPDGLAAEIDAVNQRIYDTVNNGVYKCGFATTQEAYEKPFRPLFETLDWLEERLATRRYLMGERITEADWRLFTTLVRFDAVYHGHFKCNLRRIADYPNLQGYLRELYQWPGIRETVDFRHIKGHYYESHKTINPTGVVPLGPELTLDAPHGRDQLRRAA
ncbi:glutathione S-transferase family protein [Aureimonas sp. AU4]|uniref:glutathione S-transferase family protein n=1 Tax=Aureimonas sp. AU4 TaxID=1638163 RepID=UPI0007855084|nr:glutathione S-transferase family protein [Aureimonas sp. AU4]